MGRGNKTMSLSLVKLTSVKHPLGLKALLPHWLLPSSPCVCHPGFLPVSQTQSRKSPVTLACPSLCPSSSSQYPDWSFLYSLYSLRGWNRTLGERKKSIQISFQIFIKPPLRVPPTTLRERGSSMLRALNLKLHLVFRWICIWPFFYDYTLTLFQTLITTLSDNTVSVCLQSCLLQPFWNRTLRVSILLKNPSQTAHPSPRQGATRPSQVNFSLLLKWTPAASLDSSPFPKHTWHLCLRFLPEYSAPSLLLKFFLFP